LEKSNNILAIFTTIRLAEFSAVKAKTTHYVMVNFGLVNAVGKEYAGKKVQPICQKYVMIAGLKSINWA